MKTKLGESQNVGNELDQLDQSKLEGCCVTVVGQTTCYRYQDGYFSGSGINYNSDTGNSRYGTKTPEMGTIYITEHPSTAIKEVLKDRRFVDEQTLQKGHMVTLQTKRDLKIVDVGACLPHLSWDLHDITASVYTDMQALATHICDTGLFDGIQYPSNKTTKACIALWGKPGSESEQVKTISVVPLTNFKHSGKDIDELLGDVGIQRMEDL